MLDLNTIAPAAVPGPYIKRAGDRCLYAEVGGEMVLLGMAFQGLHPTITPAMSEATAQQFKAAPDLFAVTLELARLADQAHELDEQALRQRVAALFDPAEVALARATGLLG
jgi:hypothetical protein